MIFSWQKEAWQMLWQAKTANRLPHAILLAGIKGIGKAHFADALTHALLCERVTAAGIYCDQGKAMCRACRLIDGKTHPNVLWVEPEKSGAAIKVDAIRYIAEFIHQSALLGDYRVVIIHPAQEMNINAQNALLKTLEEPSNGSLILLISDLSQRLAATIVSRCQRLFFTKPCHEDALTWLDNAMPDKAVDSELLLKLANGAPLAALKMLKDNSLTMRKELYDSLCIIAQKKYNPLLCASVRQGDELLLWLDFILSFLGDVLRLQLGVDEIVNEDYRQSLETLKHQMSVMRNMELMEYLLKERSFLCSGMNLNKQMIMEGILIRWAAA